MDEFKIHFEPTPKRPALILSPNGNLWINEDAEISDLRKAVFLLNKHYQTNWINKKKLDADDNSPF